MKLDIYQVDAFSSKVFEGNPAAVVPLESWIPDDVMLKIAIENNLSETAFFVREGENFHLRWFTPGCEVDLCGHATLAAAFIIFNQLGYTKPTVTFTSLSGNLYVHKTENGLMMDFPVWPCEKMNAPEVFFRAFQKAPHEYYIGNDVLAVFRTPQEVLDLRPDFYVLKQVSPRGIIVTAPGEDGYDFVSRAFFPSLNIDEDPVTGSSHCSLTPYWADRLGKTSLKARQISARGGDLFCELNGDRVEITGQAVIFMKGEFYV